MYHLLGILTISLLASSTCDPHQKLKGKSLLPTGRSHGPGEDHPIANLSCNVTSIDGLGAIVRVSWMNVGNTLSSDWIGMFNADSNLATFTAPVKFKYVNPDGTICHMYKTKAECQQNPLCQFDRDHCGVRDPPHNGSLTFYVDNMRSDVYFVYVSGDIQYPSLVATSPVVKMVEHRLSRGVHLALGASPDVMSVYWQAGKGLQEPGVKFGRTCERLDQFAPAVADPKRQYKSQDMCDSEVQPAGRHGWVDPGVLYEASLTGLVPGSRYCYSFGDSRVGYSAPQRFNATVASAPNQPTVVAAFGDLGQAEPDEAFHHSWDFNNAGELPSMNTTNALLVDEAIDLVYHIGDISYAVGYMSEWDNFFRQIEPVASRVPWMTGIGNHEYGYSESFIPGTDSGGECGVPYNAYFPFASQTPAIGEPLAERRPWYTFEHGSVTFIQMSTEHNFTRGSEQHKWIAASLAAVDRTKTPWLVFSGHRPMHIDFTFPGDGEFGSWLSEEIESLLVEFKVDLALWAHYHAYQRFCPMINGSCDPSGVQHLVIGMAGYYHSDCPETKASVVSICDDQHYGFLRMNFLDATTAEFSFKSAATGAVVDHFALRKSRAGEELVAWI